ncbi:hypothetical protein EUTSA_v10022361mg, partial [Eutrema salsugineum]
RRCSVDLPEDLLVEILSRVPEAALVRLRSTSKEWNDLIKKDKRLAKKSLVIMLIDFRVYLVNVDLHGIQESIVKKEVDINEVFHCDGLLLCTTKDNRLVVWNPCSGETRWMIKPKDSYTNFDLHALGKSSCNKYKILRVNHQHGHGFEQCLVEYEIYDFTSNSWRCVVKTRECQGFLMDDLLRFDFSTEKLESVSLPVNPLSDFPMGLSVTREEQKLCMLTLLCCYVRDIDVWIATKIESNGSMSWIKFLTNKVLVCRGPNVVSNRFLHIVGEDKCIQVDHRHVAGSTCSLLLSYVPTLVQIQQASLGVGARKASIT